MNIQRIHHVASVLGPIGHRIELAADCGTPEIYRKLDAVKWEMLEEWSKTKRAPQHVRWMHDGSMSK